MSQFDLYRNEIFNFLNTVTVKFEYLGVIRNNELQYQCTIDSDDKTTWAYYLNLVGEYHSTDTIMVIPSIDTGESISFTKENLKLHSKTALLYHPGTDEYDRLLARYPTQQALIRSIVYPATDITTAIEAEDFTILAYDDSYLHVNERYDLVEHLAKFMEYNSNRWYVQEFNYEELYPLAFWAIIWYNAASSLFARRLANLYTPKVHSFHIWEYLTSKGLGDYSNILTDEQSLFLYRNMNYIYKNKGRESNLIILAENLLKRLRVTVVGKTIYQNNTYAQSTCLWTPEFLSDTIADFDTNKPDININTFEDVADINRRLYTENIEVYNDLDYIASVTEKLATTDRNILPTKLVELEKYILDNKYENLLFRFTLDTLIQRLSLGQLEYTLAIADEVTNTNIEEITISNTLILLYYSIHKERGSIPINLPQLYTANTGYTDRSRPTTWVDKFSYVGYMHKLSDFIDVPSMLNDIRYDDTNFDQDEFMDLVADQFDALVKHIRYIRASSCKLTHLAVAKLYEDLIPIRHLSIDLAQENTYSEWLSSHAEFADVVNQGDTSSNPEEFYLNLSNYLIDILMPFSNGKFYKYLAMNDGAQDDIYIALKSLFIQLCSYNITFLDTKRVSAVYFFMSNLPVDACALDDATDTTELDILYWDINLLGSDTSEIVSETDITGHELDPTTSTSDMSVEYDIAIALRVDAIQDINLYKHTTEYIFKELDSVMSIGIDPTMEVSISEQL